VDEDAINYDRRSDGMYPLITNDKSLSPQEVLEAHKRQPQIEKRFAQLKSGQEIAPVFLKNEGRIEALFLLHFLAMLVEGLIERDLRKAMKRDKIESLPLYGEGRSCPLPTCEQIFRLFAMAERNTIRQDGSVLKVFDVELTDLQQTVLRLLGVPTSAYRA
jgi:transposase